MKTLLCAMVIWVLAAEAHAADPRWYLQMPPTYRAPLTSAETERRERLHLEREQTEELRQLRNDGEDRAHRETMERFRERLRKQED